MTGQPQEAISALEQQLVTLLVPNGTEPAQPAVVPKEQQQQEPPNPEPVETAPVEKSPEELAAEAEAAKATEQHEPADRIRMGKEYTDADKALVNAAHMLVKAGRAKDFTEAFARVSGLTQPVQEQPPEPVAPEPPAEIVSLESEIAGLEAKLDAIAEAEGVFTPEINALNKQLSRANAKLEAARVRFDSQVETKTIVDDASFEQQRSDVLKVTARDYPQMMDKTSEQWNLARDLAKAASDPSHPDYQQSIGLEAPRFFAQKAAKLLQIKPATAPPSAPQPPTATSSAVNQPPKPGPAPGSRTTAPTPTITPQDIARMGDELVANVLSGKGGPPKAAPPRYIMLGR